MIGLPAAGAFLAEGRTEPGAHAASRAVTRHCTRAVRGAVLRARSACVALGRAIVERASIAAILGGGVEVEVEVLHTGPRGCQSEHTEAGSTLRSCTGAGSPWGV